MLVEETILCSSAVEPTTVNRLVPGSNPGGGVRRGMSPPATVLTTLCWRVGYSLITPLQTVRMLGLNAPQQAFG